MIDRVRENTKSDERRDKLMALGKLSAGLAHELNNPAAAARRTSDELSETLEELRLADLNLCRQDLSHEQREFLSNLERDAIEGNQQTPVLGNALAMSDREDKLINWIEAHKIDEGWHLAPVLAEAGIDVERLEQIIGCVQVEALKDVLSRLVLQITVSKLASEIKTSVTRISDLVGAIKEYRIWIRRRCRRLTFIKAWTIPC
jgi:C4-dicarboxylate-specific signal transduction histidine kinase